MQEQVIFISVRVLSFEFSVLSFFCENSASSPEELKAQNLKLKTQALSFLIASVNFGTTSNASPTIP
jgi:hypothetical protein